MMTLIVGLRGESTGIDTPTYLAADRRYLDLPLKEIIKTYVDARQLTVKNYGEFEIGYVIVSKFLYACFHTQQAMLLFMAVVTFFCFWISTNYLSDDPYLSTFLLMACTFFFHTLNIARQMTVVALLTIVYLLLLKKHNVWALLVFLFALSLHQTAVIGFLVYLIAIRILPIRRSILVALACGLLGFVAFLPIITRIFLIYFPKYEGFLNHKDLESIGGISLVWMMEVMMCFYLIIYGLNHIEKKDLRIYDRHLYCSVGFTFIYIATGWCSQYVWLTDRIGLYFQIGTLYMIPMFLERIKKATPKALYCIITAGIYAVFFLWFAKTFNDPIYKYISPWIRL